MDIRFDGKRALVTGAGKGIGRELVLKLLECGSEEVVAVSRTQADLDELKKIDPKIRTLCLDVSDWEATRVAMLEVGPIDLLVNNAGILLGKEFGQYTEEDVDRIFDTNTKSIINISQVIADNMKSRGKGGVIVNVSSVSSIQAVLMCGVYGSSKAAIDQVTRVMAAELGPHNIRVNSVNPSAVRTRMTIEKGLFDENNKSVMAILKRIPLRKLGEVSDVVHPILFLLSEKSSMVTGVSLVIDGGLAVNYT